MPSPLLAIFGWPVSHSKSPAMQGAAMAAAGIAGSYEAIAAEPGRFGEAVRAFMARGGLGANVTIPHKEAAAALADELTPAARLAGAANTLLFRGGLILAHNTDGEGAVDALRAVGADFRGADVLILGAGGAARGCAVGAALAGAARIAILNRTTDRAEALAKELRSKPGLRRAAWSFGALTSSHLPFTTDRLPPATTRPPLVAMQCTSIGMHGEDDPPIDPALLPSDSFALEAVYAPLETPFLRMARARGIRCADGLAMLAGQGAAAFRFWFGFDPDARAMREALVAPRPAPGDQRR